MRALKNQEMSRPDCKISKSKVPKATRITPSLFLRARPSKKKSRAMQVRIPVTKGAFKVKNKEYHLVMTTPERRKILDILARQKKGKGNIVGLWKGLLARRTLGKNRLSDKQKRAFTEDMNYLRQKYGSSPDWLKKKASSAYLLQDVDEGDFNDETSTSDESD
jgi:hypothetical protein